VVILVYVGVAVAAYLLGSIPTGFLVGKAFGIDVRAGGSGNIGATNVFRLLGKPAGIFVLTVDGLKGYLACGMVARLGLAWAGAASDLQDREQVSIVAGLAAILGHNYTCWLRFKGGKGIATSAGVLAALLPWSFLGVLGVWICVFAVSRYVSLASITAAVALPVVTWLLGQSGRMVVVAAAMGALAVYKHKANLGRLLSGTEHRFGSKRSPSSTQPP
jgi:glycerol-3-phosphate acyltransferase PlsY